MAISWGQGLLAGAAGVAEYSQQEQAKRQQRLDKTTDLQNRMRIEQAKSKYSVKLNAHTKNANLLNMITGMKAGSFNEQAALFRAQGYTGSDVSAMAAAAVNGKIAKLTRPEAMAEPSLSFQAIKPGRARSPIDDWIRNYRQEGVQDSEQQIRDEFQREETEREAAAPQLGSPVSAPAAPFSPDQVPAISTSLPESGDVREIPKGLGAFDPLATMNKPTKPTYHTIEIPDPADPDKVESWQVAKDPLTGEEMYRSRLKSRFTEESNRDREDEKAANKPTRETKAGRISTGEIDQFIKEDGGFEQIFQAVDSLDSNFFGIGGTDNFKQIKRAIASTYLTTQQNLIKGASDEDVVKFGTQMDREAQGVAILRNVNPKEIAKMIADEGLNVNIFKGPQATQLGDILDNLEKLDYDTTELEDYMIQALSKSKSSDILRNPVQF